MLDVNQIIKDLASMVHEQGDTIGKCHMKIMGFITLFHSSNVIFVPHQQPFVDAVVIFPVFWAFCAPRDVWIWQAAQCNKVLMLWTVCWYI